VDTTSNINNTPEWREATHTGAQCGEQEVRWKGGDNDTQPQHSHMIVEKYSHEKHTCVITRHPSKYVHTIHTTSNTNNKQQPEWREATHTGAQCGQQEVRWKGGDNNTQPQHSHMILEKYSHEKHICVVTHPNTCTQYTLHFKHEQQAGMEGGHAHRGAHHET